MKFNLFKGKHEEQDKCEHDYFEVPMKVKGTNYSLINLLFGDATKIDIETKVLICKKCRREVFVEVN